VLLTYERVQVLLEPRQHAALMLAAKRAKKSVSELVRDVMEQYFTENDEMLEALEILSSQIQAKQGVYHGDPVNEARAEREARMDEVLKQWE